MKYTGRTLQSTWTGIAFVLIAVATPAMAQFIIQPVTPPAITPPAGNIAFIEGNGVGTQGYICLPSGDTTSWTVNPSRPQATLSVTFGNYTKQILTHFLSPNPSSPWWNDLLGRPAHGGAVSRVAKPSAATQERPTARFRRLFFEPCSAADWKNRSTTGC